MPAPLPIEMRRQIVERHEQGESLRSVSAELKLSYSTVKNIWAYWRGNGTLQPNYEQAKQTGTRQYSAVYDMSLQLKRDHPTWGAGLIHLQLEKIYPDQALPSVRTLQRWFRMAGIGRSPKVQKRKSLAIRRGHTVHEVWAVDAKEKIRLSDGSKASWLTMTDEASGAILHSESFSPRDMGASPSRSSTKQLPTSLPDLGDAYNDTL